MRMYVHVCMHGQNVGDSRREDVRLHIPGHESIAEAPIPRKLFHVARAICCGMENRPGPEVLLRMPKWPRVMLGEQEDLRVSRESSTHAGGETCRGDLAVQT